MPYLIGGEADLQGASFLVTTTATDNGIPYIIPITVGRTMKISWIDADEFKEGRSSRMTLLSRIRNVYRKWLSVFTVERKCFLQKERISLSTSDLLFVFHEDL